jgi:lipoprotein NlpD
VEQSQLREPVAVPIACTPRSDWAATYVVQPGDTLFRLAQSFGLSLAELQAGNCIPDAGDIDAGQVLRVPFSRPSAPSESSAPPTEPPAPGQPPPPTATSAPPTAPPTDTSTPSPTKFVPPTKPPTK